MQQKSWILLLAIFYVYGCLPYEFDYTKNQCNVNAKCGNGYSCICNMEEHIKICVEKGKIAPDMIFATKETICITESDTGIDAETDIEVDVEIESPDADQDSGQDVSPDMEPDTTPDTGEDVPCIPSAEICDSKDNNCDSQTDEGFDNLNQPCSAGTGECFAEGIYICSADNSTTACNAVASQSIPEICDDLDNDCDGTTDEELVGCCDEGNIQECGIDIGECLKGQMTCQANGSWSSCKNTVEPTADLCDSKDNDCDNKTDEDYANLNTSCQIGLGMCLSRGIYVCREDKLTTVCNAPVIRPVQEICDQKDNDCDGQTDEALANCCVPNTQVECGTDTGECQKGRKTCSLQGDWSECIGEIKPVEEICDAKDNNCNGRNDEIFANLGNVCQRGQGNCLSNGHFVCSADKRSTVCDAREIAPVVETCDNHDNNCDGRTDEDLSRECGSDIGECQKGTQTCVAGRWSSCNGEIQPSNELCDSLDNNCNNQTDESFHINDECSSGKGECQAQGVIICKEDHTNSICNAVSDLPSEEICDGLDNDCDDQTDEEMEDCCKPGTISECGTTDVGECKKGTSTCQQDRSWGWCMDATGPSLEECDGKDNDCDGETDNDIPGCCSPGISRNCGTDIGECQHGTQICWQSREWGECQNQISPIDEVCDTLDNNCDGFTDEDFDFNLDPNNCGSCGRVCSNAGTTSVACVNGECQLTCIHVIGSAYDVRLDVNQDPTDGCECEVTNCGVEDCDEIDNDCNGAIDENCESLVMYLSFDNHFNDGSPNGNNAVNHGASFTADSVCGQAASFDGVDDYAEVADSVSMDSIADEFTFFVTVKARSAINGTAIFNKAFRKPSLEIRSIGNCPSVCWTYHTSGQNFGYNPEVNTSVWQTIIGRYQNGQITVFANNVQAWTKNFVAFDPGAQLYIGSYVNDSGFSNSVIDEFSFFNKALSDAEIQHYFTILRQ